MRESDTGTTVHGSGIPAHNNGNVGNNGTKVTCNCGGPHLPHNSSEAATWCPGSYKPGNVGTRKVRELLEEKSKRVFEKFPPASTPKSKQASFEAMSERRKRIRRSFATGLNMHNIDAIRVFNTVTQKDYCHDLNPWITIARSHGRCGCAQRFGVPSWKVTRRRMLHEFCAMCARGLGLGGFMVFTYLLVEEHDRRKKGMKRR